MPNGDVLEVGAFIKRVKMLDKQDVSGFSPWLDVLPFPNMAFHADQMEAGASVEIMVSNAELKPENSVDGVVTRELNQSALATSPKDPYNWVKVKKIQGTTPISTTVIFVGRPLST